MTVEPRWIYVGVVAAVGAAVLLRTLLWIGKIGRERRNRLAERRWFDALRTSTPVEEPAAEAKQRGAVSIDHQTTVTKRMVVPLILGFTSALAVLPFVGQLPAQSLSLVIAAITVVLGVAARPTVENAFAGLTLAHSRHFNIGDTVEVDGVYGTVEDITLSHTTIKVWDWRRYVVPNSKMLQSNVLNLSLHDRYQWAYVEFFVAYDADLDEVQQVAVEAARSSDFFAGHEPPEFWIQGMAEHSYRCWVAAWADTPSNAWMLRHQTRERLLREFRARGIRAHGMRHEVHQAA